MPVINVALLQMTAVSQNPDDNRVKGDAYCRKAAESGADIALFPEMWSNGYAPPGDANDSASVAAWSAGALTHDGTYVTHFRSLARELNMAIAITYLEKTAQGPANSVTLIDRHGREQFTYTKVHTCDWDFEARTKHGEDFYVTDLDTASGPVRVGAMICYDREHPESARILMIKGSELILVPNACYLDELRLTQFRVRSYENAVALAMTNYANINGQSLAFTGVPDDDQQKLLAIQADNREDVFIAKLDIGHLRSYRPHSIWGSRFRQPTRYSALVAP